MISAWPRAEWAERWQKKKTLALFLLEELDLRVWESSNPMFFAPDHSFKTFLLQLDRAIEILAGS
jgi:hypothetical protein